MGWESPGTEWADGWMDGWFGSTETREDHEWLHRFLNRAGRRGFDWERGLGRQLTVGRGRQLQGQGFSRRVGEKAWPGR